jgi:hypothetical protein
LSTTPAGTVNAKSVQPMNIKVRFEF